MRGRRQAKRVARRLRQESERITGAQLLDAQIHANAWLQKHLMEAADNMAKSIDSSFLQTYLEGDIWPPLNPRK